MGTQFSVSRHTLPPGRPQSRFSKSRKPRGENTRKTVGGKGAARGWKSPVPCISIRSVGTVSYILSCSMCFPHFSFSGAFYVMDKALPGISERRFIASSGCQHPQPLRFLGHRARRWGVTLFPPFNRLRLTESLPPSTISLGSDTSIPPSFWMARVGDRGWDPRDGGRGTIRTNPAKGGGARWDGESP